MAIGAAVLALSLPVGASASATIYFRSVTTAQTGSGAGTITLKAPTNTAVGDVMVMTVVAEGTGSLTLPSGWTTLYNNLTDYYNCCAADSYAIIGEKVVTSADVGASYTTSLGSTRKAVGKIADYVGVNGSVALQTATSTGYANSTSVGYPSITTSVSNEMVVLSASVYNGSGTFTFTPPSGTTNRASVYTSGSGSVEGDDTADFVQATAGSTGTPTGTASVSSAWGTMAIGMTPLATGSLQFAVAPATPLLPSVILNGAAQTKTAQMKAFAVDDTTGSGSGWHVQVNGNSGSGYSPVFAQYCPTSGGCANASGGTDPQGYVSAGQRLPANSLTFNTTGGSWSTTGGAGASPSFTCGSGCPMDASSATTVASAATGAGEGPWATSAFGSTSLSLAVPTPMRVIPPSEVYRVDLLWTLATGP